jgi:hypothetical protein
MAVGIGMPFHFKQHNSFQPAKQAIAQTHFSVVGNDAQPLFLYF